MYLNIPSVAVAGQPKHGMLYRDFCFTSRMSAKRSMLLLIFPAQKLEQSKDGVATPCNGQASICLDRCFGSRAGAVLLLSLLPQMDFQFCHP